LFNPAMVSHLSC